VEHGLAPKATNVFLRRSPRIDADALHGGAGDWGDCVQIFFEYGDVVGRPGILVGHIGPHLDISSARS
jgi:hypothetical protein